MNMDETIQHVVETIRDRYRPDKIILFGSRVWGSADEESDLDVLVIKESKEPEVERIREVSRMLRPRLLPLDILVKTPEEVRRRLLMGDDFLREVILSGMRFLYQEPRRRVHR